MPEIAYLSRSGEVKIPLRLRTRLGLQPGEKFEVTAADGGLSLRRVALPAHDQLEQFIAWTKKNAKQQTPRTITISGKASPRRIHATAKRLKKAGAKKIVLRTGRN